MFHAPRHWQNVSLQLASALEDIGINERIVLKRRESCLLGETLMTIMHRLTGRDISVFNFGSQSEGTTTPGLNSDSDFLGCFNIINVLQNWRDWTPDLENLLMLQGENTPLGYCMLQLLYSNEPLPVTEVPNDDYASYSGDKVVMNNTHIDRSMIAGQIRDGPSGSVRQQKGYRAVDIVFAFPCKSMPLAVRRWLNELVVCGKLSPDMIRYIQSSKCYVVPVGSSDSEFNDYEWRISTSHAERCVMFNLNITQLQCYVLMKMIFKTYLKSPHDNALSSFMCKNIVLLFFQHTRSDIWRPANLIALFELCLFKLQQSIQYGYCPHFIMKHNLMRNKFSAEGKRWLIDRIQQVIDLHEFAFLGVTMDEFGCRLQMKFSVNSACYDIASAEDISRQISGNFMYNLAVNISDTHKNLLKVIFLPNVLNKCVSTLTTIYRRGSCLERAASSLLIPLICSTIGTMKASSSIHMNHSVLPEALTWLSLGLDSDVASGRLKQASVYYCVGDWYNAEIVLRNVEEKYIPGVVESVCACYEFPSSSSVLFEEYSRMNGLKSFKDISAFCVMFLLSEIHCVPHELQYELFRSTPEDLPYRGWQDDWMDWAVVDYLPYLYFLQYKTYGHLQRYNDQHQALNNLIKTIFTERNFGHRETALNLLGQCMEQENKYNEAFQCYVMSLNIRPRNNTAKFHICGLLQYLLRSRFKCRRCVNNIQVKPPPSDLDCNSDLSQWHHSTDKKGLQDLVLKGAWVTETPISFVFHHHSHEKQRITV